jgi:hypothetical protein
MATGRFVGLIITSNTYRKPAIEMIFDAFCAGIIIVAVCFYIPGI